MPYYCVNRNAQPNGEHEVHDVSNGTWCLPIQASRFDLGYHANCTSAVQEAARRGIAQVNGCRWCASACHTG